MHRPKVNNTAQRNSSRGTYPRRRGTSSMSCARNSFIVSTVQLLSTPHASIAQCEILRGTSLRDALEKSDIDVDEEQENDEVS